MYFVWNLLPPEILWANLIALTGARHLILPLWSVITALPHSMVLTKILFGGVLLKQRWKYDYETEEKMLKNPSKSTYSEMELIFQGITLLLWLQHFPKSAAGEGPIHLHSVFPHLSLIPSQSPCLLHMYITVLLSMSNDIDIWCVLSASLHYNTCNLSQGVAWGALSASCCPYLHKCTFFGQPSVFSGYHWVEVDHISFIANGKISESRI